MTASFARVDAISMDESISSAAALGGSLRSEEHRRLMEDFAAAVKELLELTPAAV